MYLKFISSYQVINTGQSMAPNVSVEIMIPNSFIPQTDKLFNILDVQVKKKKCDSSFFLSNIAKMEIRVNLFQSHSLSYKVTVHLLCALWILHKNCRIFAGDLHSDRTVLYYISFVIVTCRSHLIGSIVHKAWDHCWKISISAFY